MECFLNSASVEEIETALEMWDIDGVTMSPRRIKESGKGFLPVVKEIGEMLVGTNKIVAVPTNPHHQDDYGKIVDDAHRLVDLNLNFVISIPSTAHGFKASDILSEEGIRTNMTLCFSPFQALQAMRMGATYISPFSNTDVVSDDATRQLIRDIMTLKAHYPRETEVMVSAANDGQQIINAALAGADVVTAPFDIYNTLYDNDLTQTAINTLKTNWDQTAYE